MQTPHNNQIRWACRRGMLELDNFLLAFFDDCYEGLSDSDQKTFILLLNEQDQDLYNWLLGVSVASDPKLQALCEKIHTHAQQAF